MDTTDKYRKTCKNPNCGGTQELYEEALSEGSFKKLLPFPCLLFRWQLTHEKDAMRIATISSHKLDRHDFCATPDKCKTVSEFIKTYDAL